MIKLYKEVPGGFELIGEFGDDLAAAMAAAEAHAGWQIEDWSDGNARIVASQSAAP